MPEPAEWFAYVNDDGSFHVKSFSGDLDDVAEQENDPLTLALYGPFEAMDKNEAATIAQIQLQSFLE